MRKLALRNRCVHRSKLNRRMSISSYHDSSATTFPAIVSMPLFFKSLRLSANLPVTESGPLCPSNTNSRIVSCRLSPCPPKLRSRIDNSGRAWKGQPQLSKFHIGSRTDGCLRCTRASSPVSAERTLIPATALPKGVIFEHLCHLLINTGVPGCCQSDVIHSVPRNKHHQT